MQSDTALVLLSIAVAVSSLSLLVQAIASWRIYLSVRKLQEEVAPLIPKARSTLEQAEATLRQASAELRQAGEKAKELMGAVQQQVDGIDRARQELATQWRVQSERIDLVLEDILGRVQDVVGVLHGTVMRPVREVSGMVAGVKAALQTLLMSRRPTVDRVTHEDEMFI
jgi:ABC-type transporter Mla subunit MlaD